MRLPMMRAEPLGAQRMRRTGVGPVRFAGWVLFLMPIAIVGYEAARLTPIFFNYVKVARTLDQVAAEYHDGDDPESLTRSIGKHFESESVLYPQAKDIRITRDGSQWRLEAAYDDQAPLFFNMAVVVSFDKTVRAPTGAR
jgi:hypothetical protein